MTRFLNFNKTLSLNIIQIFSYLRDCVYYHIWDDLIKLRFILTSMISGYSTPEDKMEFFLLSKVRQ